MTNALENPSLTRRGFLRGTGALVVSFTLMARAAQEPHAQGLPGSLRNTPQLDAWIRIDAKGAVTVFTGKAELGQGIKTALIQVAAEELEVEPQAIRLITADTARTANEGMTAGSHSLQDSGTAIRNAAAQVRELLIAAAAARWQVDPSTLRAERGAIVANDHRKLGYGQLVRNELLHVTAQPESKLKDPKAFLVIGQPMQRVDIPAKVTGGVAYVQDLRLPGMVHGRVVRPIAVGAQLLEVDTAAVAAMPGVLKVVRDGNFLAVVAAQEYQAVLAMRALARAARWSEGTPLPARQSLPEMIMSLPAEDGVVIDQTSGAPSPGRSFEATFTRPYQCHASVGPSCAVAKLEGDEMTIWTHVQGVYPNRAAVAQMLQMPREKVRCIHTEGSGCYGHNGADDAAADAALLARAMAGRPVRVQWMREQEHVWEPFGPAMVTKVRATVDEHGTITAWNYELWSNPHGSRPGPAGALVPARDLAEPFMPNPPKLQISAEGNADRNAVPLYSFPNKHVVWHFLRDMPIRVSALRSLGAFMNVFSIESSMDELAIAAAADPVEFRLRHLQDPRARAVVRTAAEKFGWGRRPVARNHGHGFAFARYKNLAAFCAIALDIEIEPESGRVRLTHVVAAVDSGEIVNPDGLRNQIEGGIIQSMSWTLFEAVTFDEKTITSSDWSTYPIARFASVPDSIEVHLLPQPGKPFLGAGEASQGPAGAAVGNAIADAARRRLGANMVGKPSRLTDLPLTRDKVRALLARA